MADKRLSRRQMVQAAGALGAAGAVAILQGSTPAHADVAQAGATGIVGSWVIASSPDGDRLLYSFTPGGVLIKTRAGAMMGSGKHPNLTGALHGAWVSTGNRRFSTTTYEFRTDSKGNFIGTFTIQDSITLDPHLDTFSAAWTFGSLNADGSVSALASGTLHGKRIKVKKT